MKSRKVKLGELVSITKGSKADNVYPAPCDNARRYIQISDLHGSHSQRYAISRDSSFSCATDVLLAWDGANAGTVGFGFEGFVGSTLAILRPNLEIVDTRYLGRFLQSKFNLLNSQTTGATIPHISRSVLESLLIPLPALNAQRRTAAILDKVNSIQEKIKKQTDMSAELVLGTFSDLFGDPVRNSKKWKTIEIEKLCHLVRGSSPRPQGDPRYFGGDVPRLMVADLTRDGWFVTPRIDTLTREGARHSRPVARGTIVMAVSGNVGIVSQLSVDACIHDGFVGFVDLDISKMLPTYLMACLELFRWTHVSRQAGAIFQNLTTTDIKALGIPVPPLELQKQFEAVFSKITALKSVQERRQQEVKHLLARLQRDSFMHGEKNA